MTRFLVDTNVLVAATFEEIDNHTAAQAFMARLLASSRPWCLSWVNVYEYLRVVTHARVFKRPLRWPVAREQVASILVHPRLEILVEGELHLDALERVVEEAGGASGNFVHDCHVAALMAEHDVRRIVTADRGFRRFGGIEVLLPEEVGLDE